MDRLLKAEEVARLLDVNLSVVYRWAAAGRLPAVKLGRALRFRERELEELLDRSRVDGELS